MNDDCRISPYGSDGGAKIHIRIDAQTHRALCDLAVRKERSVEAIVRHSLKRTIRAERKKEHRSHV